MAKSINPLKSFIKPKSKALASAVKFSAEGDNFTTVLWEVLRQDVPDLVNYVDFYEQSGNLIDSIGATVFINGSEWGLGSRGKVNRVYARKHPVSKGEHHGWKREGIPGNTGRGYLDEYFDKLAEDMRGTHGFKVYIVAAAYYGAILEAGKHPLRKQYHVITFAQSMCEGLLKKACSVFMEKQHGIKAKGGYIRNFTVQKVGTPFGLK